MKNAIIVGASSGIGAALASVLAAGGYNVFLIARRSDRLRQLQHELGDRVQYQQGDVTHSVEIMDTLREAFSTMGHVDLVVQCAGIGEINAKLDWHPELATIEVNVLGFTAVVNATMQAFLRQGSGHLVNISSIAAIRGSGEAPAYNASKSFQSNYMEGLLLKVRASQIPIVITDIQPGFVDTAMAKGDGLFWIASPQKAAAQIYRAIQKERSHAYVTRRWRFVAWFLRYAPNWLLCRMAQQNAQSDTNKPGD